MSFKASSISVITRQGINSLANSESPLKWTKNIIQSDLSDFSFSLCGFNHWRVVVTGARCSLKLRDCIIFNS
ncbi:hypothetical protein [Microseira wollei]|uniref:hypothetical protein n=1 Tax=Microseira wollei TaxID=467598 RepID=UPI001CFCDF25|nr:hypothetical protein [Microseira wollei]